MDEYRILVGKKYLVYIHDNLNMKNHRYSLTTEQAKATLFDYWQTIRVMGTAPPGFIVDDYILEQAQTGDKYKRVWTKITQT